MDSATGKAAPDYWLPVATYPMARLTNARREVNRRERLEQRKLILESKISVLQAALVKTIAELGSQTPGTQTA